MNWNNAGGAALARLDFRDALPDFLKARQTAERYQLHQPWLITMNNLTGLYLQLGDPEAAMRVARDALARATPEDDAGSVTPTVRAQLATALARLQRFDEAEPVYRQAIGEMAAQNDIELTARALGNFGSDCLEAGRLEEAEDALSEALRLVRLHHLKAAANILRALARLKNEEGDRRSASALFDAAIQAPESLTPQWLVYADRGQFRLGLNDLRGALADFREARRIASQMRADIVPADQDRVALEGELNGIAEGLVDAGNRLAERTSDDRLRRETFDAAEQDRLWSLRALVPAANDWRTRLPAEYWDLLAQYQTVERNLIARGSPGLQRQAAGLEIRLQQIEAAASGRDSGAGPSELRAAESAVAHAERVLGPDSVLFSFRVTSSSGWIWAVDRRGVNVYPIPRFETLKALIADFAQAARTGDAQATVLGSSLYQVLFGNVAPRYLAHKRWLLELDGPLFDLPFAALVPNTGKRQNEPGYLFERAVLETIPGALMLEPAAPIGNGPFLGVGDPIYNAADSRYRGIAAKQDVSLPRLPATARELESCSRAWNPANTRILTGANASLASVRKALRLTRPSVIHFATHVVSGRGDYASGLIALSLDSSGAMGLMGPAEIVANTISPSLVVLDGCHSGQGETLPASGLMGLTRAWIGAGARSVLATRWDIPDAAGPQMLVEFYRALRRFPERGPAFALQQAQIAFHKKAAGAGPAIWGAYFVLGRE